MSLELSKEMISVQGYLGDAKLLMSQQVGAVPPDFWPRGVIEIARMLQQERHHQRKKLVDKAGSVPLTRSRSAQAVLDARKNPQTPPVVSFDDDEPTPKPRRKAAEPKKKVESKKKVEPKKKIAKPRRR
jgi:outer membrane biosynthesis protein TonB